MTQKTLTYILEECLRASAWPHRRYTFTRQQAKQEKDLGAERERLLQHGRDVIANDVAARFPEFPALASISVQFKTNPSRKWMWTVQYTATFAK